MAGKMVERRVHRRVYCWVVVWVWEWGLVKVQLLGAHYWVLQ